MKFGRVALGVLSGAVIVTSLTGAVFQQLSTSVQQNISVIEVDGLSPVAPQNDLPDTWKEFSESITAQPVPTRPTPQPTSSVAPSDPAVPAIPEVTGALNVLVLGSDTREGQGNGFGDVSGARSDTAMLVHLSGDGERATVVSFPRDLVVDIPACKGSSATHDRFNVAFARGGPNCVVKTVKQLTGIPVHHVMVVDFRGFADVVDALGGIDVCLTKPVSDEKAKVDLPAGQQTVNGREALGLARARYNVGDGSDLSRIDRQQALARAAYRQIRDSGALQNPVTAFSLADAVLASVSTDKGLASAPAMAALLYKITSIPLPNVDFYTVPWAPAGDGATVVLDWPSATELFTAIVEDRQPDLGDSDGATTSVTAGSEKASDGTVCKDPIL